MVFGAGFVSLKATTLGGNSSSKENTSAAHTTSAAGVGITQSQEGSDADEDSQPDMVAHPTRMLPRTPSTTGQLGGLGISMTDWLQVSVAPTSPETMSATIAGMLQQSTQATTTGGVATAHLSRRSGHPAPGGIGKGGTVQAQSHC